jgi:hypothetical protein
VLLAAGADIAAVADAEELINSCDTVMSQLSARR